MKKEIAIVVAAIILLSVLAVLPVISSDENATNVNKNYDANGEIISSAIITNQTGVSESELPIDVAANDDLVEKIAFYSDRDGDKSEHPINVAVAGDSGGKIAFYSDRDGDDEIYVMNADGTNVKKLTNNTAADWYPAWSPDGSRIAFNSDRDGDREIYVMNSDGSDVVQLTKNSIVDLGPSWSPDGKKIAFKSGSSLLNTGIYVMNADGSDIKSLADPHAYISNQAWSPDGSKIVFSTERNGEQEIYVMNSADGSNKRRLISPAYSKGYKMDDCKPAWSPVGDKIVFYSFRHGYHETTPGTYEVNGEIYIMDPDGNNLVRLTNDPYHTDYVPSWSPDGTRIAFASKRDGDYEIYVMDADGTNVRKLTSNTKKDTGPSWCCISGDGEATVTIESASAAPGSTDTVPIRITNVTNLATANIWLSYNKDVVIVESISEGDLSPITPAIDNAAGVMKMNWFSATGKTGDFVFAYVTLKAVGSAGQSSSLDLDVKELGDASANAIPRTVNDGTFTIKLSVFDTGPPANPYPSISGTHSGTLTPNQTITVSSLYTYPCAGTGGHTEYAKIWNDTWTGEEAFWDEYQGNWHSIAFDNPFTLFADKEYYYEIRTGSYPQIHHTDALSTAKGWINCTSFVDANGKEYNGWIPAIKLA